MSQESDLAINRRDFVTAAALAAAVAGVGSMAGSAAFGQATTQPSTAGMLDVGLPSDYAKDGPNMTWADDHKIIVMRQSGKIFAMTSKCTHRGCTVTDTGSQFNCPCHNSDFQYDGEIIDGPAKRALPRYGISVDANGHLMVNVHQTFPQAQWTDPASFFTIPAA